jgi:hypothetical protein
MWKFIVPIITLLVFSSCGDSESENTKITHVDILTEIELPTSASPKRVVKSISSENIDKITLTVFDSAKTYYKDEEFNRGQNNSWSLELNGIPTEREMHFSAKAVSSNGHKILEGYVIETLSSTTPKITIPVEVTYFDSNISEPSLTTILNVSESGNYSDTNLTFTISNSNNDTVHWKLKPDSGILNSSDLNFQPIDGTLNRDGTISGSVDFSTFKSETAEISVKFSGDVGTAIYSQNTLVITNAIEDTTETTFSIYSPRDEIAVSLAPILDNIYLTFYEDQIEAKALIYGDFPLIGEWGCENQLEDLKDFTFANQDYESLLFHYYGIVYENLYVDDFGNEIDVNETITYLNNYADNNFTRLMNLDINDSWETVFGELQAQYYDDLDFKELDKILHGDGFQNMLHYFLGDKSLLVAFESYYTDTRRSDYNGTLIYILDRYKRKRIDFDVFLEFMVDEPSTMLEDFDILERNFTENGDYYYAKFQAEDSRGKDELHSFVAKIEDEGFTNFIKVFSESGSTLYDLLEIYYDLPDIDSSDTDENVLLYKRIKEKFSKLLDLRIDESMNSLLTSLKNKYSSGNDVDFENFLTLHENRGFQEFREYYMESDDPSPQLLSSLESKYDETICVPREEDETVRYSWKFASEPDVEIGATNPLVLPFDGTLIDTIILEANRVTLDENNDLIESKVEYRVDVNIKDYHDQEGNPIAIPVDGNKTIEDINETEEEEVPEEVLTGDPKYRFAINTYPSPLNLTLIYGEEYTINFTASYFKDENFDNEFTADINGILRFVTVESIERPTDSDTFLVTIKAGQVAGEEELPFMLQNYGHTDVETVGIKVSSPVVEVEIDDVPFEEDETPIVELTEGEIKNIPIYVESAREGISLDFDFSGDISNFNVNNSGESVFITKTHEGVTYNLVAKPEIGTAETQERITVSVDAKDENDKYLGTESYDILLKSSAKKDLTYDFADCKDRNLYVEGYDFISATLDQKSNNLQTDLNLSLVSRNIYLQRDYPSMYGSDFHSTLYLFYKAEESDVESPLVGEVSIFSKDTLDQIGIVRYSKEAMGRDFYVKYLDVIDDEVVQVCEKMSFPTHEE